MFPSHWQGTGPSFRHSEFPVSLVPPSFISELSGPLPGVDTKLHVLCCARKHFWRVKSSRIHFQGCCWLTSQHGHPLTQNKLVPGTETHVLGTAGNRQTKGTRQWWFWISTLTFEIVCTFRMWDRWGLLNIHSEEWTKMTTEKAPNVYWSQFTSDFRFVPCDAENS